MVFEQMSFEMSDPDIIRLLEASAICSRLKHYPRVNIAFMFAHLKAITTRPKGADGARNWRQIHLALRLLAVGYTLLIHAEIFAVN